MARSLEELQNTDEPGIEVIRDWLGQASGNGAVLLTHEKALAEATLLQLQVTTRSLLGAVVYDTGGILVDDGFLRILGSGRERSLLQSNRSAGLLTDNEDPSGALLVADDVMGGLFALNGGGFGSENMGEVFYLAADEMAWTPLEMGYSDFLAWCLTGDRTMLYETLASFDAFTYRPRPPISSTYSFYPFLWTREAHAQTPDVRVIPAEEIVRLRLELVGFTLSP